MCSVPFLWMFVLLLTVVVTANASKHVTLKPLHGKAQSFQGRDVALLLVPELGVPNTDYEVFCRMVQLWNPLQLWVGLVDSSSTSSRSSSGAPLTLDILAVLLVELQQQLTQQGMSEEAMLFLAAHGQTGHVVADYASAVPQSIEGLILLGSFLPRRHQRFPLPVLTLVGELDGLTRITRIAHTLQQMLGPATTDPDFITRNPLVILKGSNHEVFVADRLPSHLHVMDIEPEVDKTVAMETASNMTSLFIASVLQEPELLFELAWMEFVKAFAEAEEIMKPIISLSNMTEENFKTGWVRSAQKWLSGLEGKESSFLAVEGFVTYEQENALPPVLGEEKGVSYIMTFSDVVRHSSLDGEDEFDALSGTRPQAPDEIAARMLGPERIQKYLKNTTVASNYTCKDLNYASFQTAYHTASEKARQRFDKRHPGIQFLPDVITDSKFAWKNTPLKVDISGQELRVTSASFQTPVDDQLLNDSGLFFCKLLPPDKALEWIYIDSLRRRAVYNDPR